MARITIQDYPVYNKYWYIVDFRDLIKVRLMPYYFVSKAAAARAIETNFKKGYRKKVEAMRGDKVKEFFLIYDMSKGLPGFTKYDYPVACVTNQDRKSHRTLMRRRLRRMGLLTLVKPKRKINQEPGVIKPIKNKQKVANNKNSAAKVVQLERKPNYYYYLILKTELAKKKGTLWKIKCLKFDKRDGTLKKSTLITLRTDIIIPYLITDLEYMVYEKILTKQQTAKYYLRRGFRLVEPQGE